MKKVTVPLEAKLWEPPNFVAVSHGEESLSMPLKDVPDDAFHALVEAWVRRIYEKAGKARPPSVG